MKNNQFIYTEKDAEKMFFTSDTHFCHENDNYRISEIFKNKRLRVYRGDERGVQPPDFRAGKGA